MTFLFCIGIYSILVVVILYSYYEVKNPSYLALIRVGGQSTYAPKFNIHDPNGIKTQNASPPTRKIGK
jgi:hypothetical protein